MNPFIENEYLRVEANLLGGCLASVYDKKAGEELLYQPEPDSWQGQDIAIFPFIARLKNKTYTHKGQTYSLRNHGLCRYYPFEVIEVLPTSMRLKFESNEETLKEYPFAFEFTITYCLEGNRLTVAYDILNKSLETMPFGLGAHPAFKIDSSEDGDTKGNYVVLSKPSHLTRIVFDEKGEFIRGEEDYGTHLRIEAKKDLFRKYQTLAVQGEGIESVALIRRNGKKLYFHFDNIRYLILWSFLETGHYVAVEPWLSLPDYEDCPTEIMEKKTLIHLAPGDKFHFSYSIHS